MAKAKGVSDRQKVSFGKRKGGKAAKTSSQKDRPIDHQYIQFYDNDEWYSRPSR